MLSHWNSKSLRFPGYHFLQTEEWGVFKSSYGWRTEYLNIEDEKHNAAALILSRKIAFLSSRFQAEVKYCPRGPLLNWTDTSSVMQVLNQLEESTKAKGVILMKVDPEISIDVNLEADSYDNAANAHRVTEILKRRGWLFSKEQIQFRNSVILDLKPDLDTLLSNMKQKTRYNIRLAEKKGVTIRAAAVGDLPLLFQMYAETSIRDGFVIREENYYIQLWRQFMEAGMAFPLIAYSDNSPIAGMVLFTFGRKAWYFFGMSRNLFREKMPTYLLQWEAIKFAKVKECILYDLWGAPEQIDEKSPMWGVYRFKEGLGGQIVRWIGAWDYTTRPALYRIYTTILPGILSLLRKRGLQITKQYIS